MQSRSYGQYALCVLLILGGLVCLTITSGSNLDVAVSLASTMGGKVFYGAGALVVDVVGVALFACVVGYLFRDGHYLAGAGMSVIVACFMTFSMVTFYGFGVKERISKTEVAQKTHDAEVSADAATLARKDAVRNRLLDDLQMETENVSSLLIAKSANVNREVAKAAIHESRNRKAEIAFSDIEVKAGPIYVDPDPMAKAIAEDTGLSISAVQKVLTLGLGVLLILAKGLAFGFGFGMWPKETDSEPEEDKAVTLAYPSPTVANDTAAPQLIHRQVDFPMAAPTMVNAYDQVKEFYEEATQESRSSHTATEIYRHYRDWALKKDYLPELTHQAFGRATKTLMTEGKVSIQRRIGSAGVEYLGRAPMYDQPMRAVA